MKQKKYDIFISYRRSSFDSANLIATRLKSIGYSVFFDMEALRSGKFNQQLFNVIENCTDFILVLPPNALDRCVNEDDWVRLEVLHAMKYNKNIIPIMLNGFTWPKIMPKGLEELPNYQALTASSVEYFDLAMERLQSRFLLSKRHFILQKYAKFMVRFVASLLILTVLLWCVFMQLSKDVCTKYATMLVKDISMVHMLAIDNADLKKKWTEFENAFKFDTTGKSVNNMQEEMLEKIDFIENNIKETSQKIDSVEYEINAYHSFLLSLNGINAKEISYSPVLAHSYFNEYLQRIECVRMAVTEINTLNIRNAATHFNISDHFINSYYAAALSLLSNFPNSSLKEYKTLSKMWTHFPVHYNFGESEEYYTEIERKEFKLIEDALAVYQAEIEHADAELNDFTRDNNTPGQLNDRMRELDEQVSLLYEEMKKESEFLDTDGQFQKWTKCYFMGNLINMIKNNQQMLYDDGFNFKLSITPHIAYNDTKRLFEKYEQEFPDSKAYVTSAKAFFKAVANNECEYAGVMVYSFKDNCKHPSLEVGDIIFEFDSNKLMSYEELKNAYSNNNSGKIKVYRSVNGKIKIIEIDKLVDSDIISFLEIVVKNDIPQE